VIFIATLQRVGEPIPVRKAVVVEGDDIDTAAANAIDTTTNGDNEGWMVVAVRDPEAIDEGDVL
jgi:hypothetical protein